MEDIYKMSDFINNDDDTEDEDCSEFWDEIMGAEQWLGEHEDLWRIGMDGFEFFTDDIPENVLAYVKNWNEVQDDFESNIKVKNTLLGK